MLLVNAVIEAVVLALAVSSITLTFTRAKLFTRLRLFATWLHPTVGELASCPYCFSHYVTALVAFLYEPTLLASKYHALDVVFTAFAIVTLANWFNGLLYAAVSSIGPPVEQQDNDDYDEED